MLRKPWLKNYSFVGQLFFKSSKQSENSSLGNLIRKHFPLRPHLKDLDRVEIVQKRSLGFSDANTQPPSSAGGSLNPFIVIAPDENDWKRINS